VVRTSFNHRVIYIKILLLLPSNRVLFVYSECLGFQVIFNIQKALSSSDTFGINGSLDLGFSYSTAEDQFVVNNQLVGHFPAEHFLEIQEYVV
jgi:hypothetical protein